MMMMLSSEWQKVHKRGEVTVMYQEVNDSKLHRLRLEGILHVSLADLLPLLLELDLYTQWLPIVWGGFGLRSSRELYHLDRFKKIGYFIISLPW